MDKCDCSVLVCVLTGCLHTQAHCCLSVITVPPKAHVMACIWLHSCRYCSRNCEQARWRSQFVVIKNSYRFTRSFEPPQVQSEMRPSAEAENQLCCAVCCWMPHQERRIMFRLIDLRSLSLPSSECLIYFYWRYFIKTLQSGPVYISRVGTILLRSHSSIWISAWQTAPVSFPFAQAI